MKIAVKNTNTVADIATLTAIPEANLSDSTCKHVLSTGDVYVYWKGRASGNLQPDDAAGGVGWWVLANERAAKIRYAVADNYDYGAADATELDYNTFASGEWFLGEYTATKDDNSKLIDAIGVAKTIRRFGLGLDNLAPKVRSASLVTSSGQSSTITIIGDNFTPKTLLNIPGWEGTIDSVTYINSQTIVAELTSGNSIATYSIVLYNGIHSSTEWSQDSGVGAISVASIPTGAQKRIQGVGSVGDVYTGTPFAKSEWSSSYSAALAFDGNNGTRHYCATGQATGHYAGLLFSQSTLIESVRVRTLDSTTSWRLEVSSDTTDGTDGTWQDCGTYNFRSTQNIPISAGALGTAMRLVYLDPSTLTGAREVIIFGKQ